jgi:hypothetical protein
MDLRRLRVFVSSPGDVADSTSSRYAVQPISAPLRRGFEWAVLEHHPPVENLVDH